MEAQIRPFDKQNLIRWIQSFNDETKLYAFEIIDTLMFYYHNIGHLPSVGSFTIEPVLRAVALYIEGYMVTHAPGVLPYEMITFEFLRPVQYPRLAVMAPTGQNLDPQPATQVPQTHINAPIRDFTEALRAEENVLAMHNKRGKTSGIDDANDFPNSAAEQQVFATRLVQAMTDMTNIVEKPNSTKVERLKNTSTEEMQILAWKVLAYTKDAQDGNLSMPSRFGKEPDYTRYQSFNERFEDVLAADSKSIVYDLMSQDYIRRLVSTPAREFSRKKTNLRGNTNKQKLIEMGTKARDQAAKEETLGTARSDLASSTTATVNTGADEPTSDGTLATHAPEGELPENAPTSFTWEEDADE